MNSQSLLCSMLTLVSLAATAGPARAGNVNLYWNDCVGDGGTTNRTFACTASTATAAAIGSFVLNTPMPDFVAVEVMLGVASGGTTLPAWWDFNPDPGACHGSSLAMTFDFSFLANNTCADPFGQPALGGLANYTTYANRGEAIGVGAIDSNSPQSLAAGVEYYAFRVAVKLDKATGAGACAGCSEPVALFIEKVDAVGLTSRESCTAAISSPCVNWNATTGFNCGRLYPVAARNVTWGEIKSFYR
jgi:hypothetical protein